MLSGIVQLCFHATSSSDSSKSAHPWSAVYSLQSVLAVSRCLRGLSYIALRYCSFTENTCKQQGRRSEFQLGVFDEWHKNCSPHGSHWLSRRIPEFWFRAKPPTYILRFEPQLTLPYWWETEVSSTGTSYLSSSEIGSSSESFARTLCDVPPWYLSVLTLLHRPSDEDFSRY